MFIFILVDRENINTVEISDMNKNIKNAYLTFIDEVINPSITTPNIKLNDSDAVYAAMYLSRLPGGAITFVTVINRGCTTPMHNPVTVDKINTSYTLLDKR